MTTHSKVQDFLTSSRVRSIRRGLEKESLRVLQSGALATSPHPPGLGSALTHPHITTDFSEAQLELITGVHANARSCQEELEHIQHITMRALGEEMLWVSSMPCLLPQDDAIPLGQYGTSNQGRIKTVYRMGLGHRYGRRMQTISGIHYNWSSARSRQRSVFRPDPQFPPSCVPVVVSLWRLPGGVFLLRCR